MIFEQLYFYNDIIEDLQIFKNKLGYLDFVIGSISDIQVECFNKARLVIYGIKDLVGIDSIDEELKCEGIDKDESGYVYKFTQVYNGIPIYGSVITLLTDLDGNVVGFNSSYIPININTTADVSGENALNKSGIEYQEFKSAELVIYIDDAEPKLSWNITYTNSSGNSCNAVVDANTAEPYIVNPLSSQIAASGKDENGIKRDFNVEYDSDEEFYVMHDYRRDITVYDLNNNINAGDYRDNEIRQINPPINSYSNDWSDDSIAVGTYVNVIKCFDYYKDIFGRNGFFLAARPIDLYINWNNYNAEYNTSTKRNLVFGKPVDDAKSWGASLQTVAHEYTHGIIDAMTDLDKNYISEAGAINEAYADAMSMIISNNTTWQVRLPKGELERDCITPSNSECPSVYSKCIEYDPDSKGTHKNSTVLSHAFYFMNSRGIGNSRLARLLYKSLLISYSEYARFTDVRKNCLLAANALGMSDFEKRIIEEAFDEVEVKLEPSTIITSDNYVTGKVVALNPGANSGDYLKLDNVKVSIRRNNNVSDYCEPVYTDNGMYKILNVLPGTYNLTFEKEGYLPTTLRISIIYREDIYLDSVEMIPSIYSGYGIAEGTVVDAVTGKGVPGLTLNLRSGLGANKGVILQTITTDDNGKYTTDSYITGHYTIEVVDKRDGVAINEKYCTAYKNINIVGKMIMRNQDIPVTTRLNAGQMRIVLEWGENPRDLDSHLLGIDCNGKERFHTYYSKKKYVNNGVTEVELDLDDVTSYGPETTTIYKKSDNKYVFYVYHYSGSGSLSTSNAIVKVYIGTGSTAKYTFNVPNDGGNGRYWTVFEYDGKTGKVSSVNIVGNSVAK